MPFAIALFCFPLVYYFTHPEDYYRRPIDPIFVILAGYALANRRAREQEDRVEPVEMLEEDELAAV
jgi:hypothetical protein